MEVTPNAKQASEREQDNVKKSKRERKNDLLKYFGNGARVPAPTNVGTPINAVIQHRESRDKGNNTHDKAGDREGGAKTSALKKSSKSLPINVSMQEDETSTNTNKKKGKKPQAAEKEG
jgi:hypothetical protein